MVDDLEAALEQSREIAVLERAPQSDIVQISSERMRLTQFVSFRWKAFRRLPSWSILEDGTLISVLLPGGCSSSSNLLTRWRRAKPTLSIRRCYWPSVIHATLGLDRSQSGSRSCSATSTCLGETTGSDPDEWCRNWVLPHRDKVRPDPDTIQAGSRHRVHKSARCYRQRAFVCFPR